MIPTKDQLDRYMSLMVDGFEAEDAVLVIWGEPEPPAPKQVKPTVMITEFPDGVIIGWDHCSRCNTHVSRCACKEGPLELRVFEQWRTGTTSMPDYGRAAKEARTEGIPTTKALGKGNAGVVVATQPTSQIPCVLGEHLVDPTVADKNDDGTYSCFTCQESGAQRVRTDA